MRYKKYWKFWILSGIIAIWAHDGARAQQGQTPVTPLAKCIIPFTINSTGTGAQGHFQPSTTGYDNRQTGCSNWSIVYSNTGFTVISLVVQSAPALSNTAPGTPDTYVTFAGTVAGGINPNTAVTQASSTFSGFYPWIRINAATLTGSGTIIGVLIGTVPIDVAGGSSTTTAGCSSVTPCIVAGPVDDGIAVSGGPVRIGGKDSTGTTQDIITDNGGILQLLHTLAGTDGFSNASLGTMFGNAGGDRLLQTAPSVFNGTTWDRQFVCNSRASVTLADTTTTILIAASGSTVIRICHIHMTTTATETFTIQQGTGAACVTGLTTIDKYISTQFLAMDFQPTAALRTTASQGVCVTQSGTQAAEVTVIYAQY